MNVPTVPVPTDAAFRVVGIAVAFAPAPAFAERMAAARDLLDHVIVVDNTPQGLSAEHRPAEGARLGILANRNAGGLAGAYNAALQALGERCAAATHVLFLDDDTEVSALAAFLDSPATRRFAASPDVAAVAAAYVDPVTGMSGAPIRLGRWTIRTLPRSVAEAVDVSLLINAMSLWRLDALRRIGAFSTDLGVDLVDTDYCLRAQMQGFRLILNATVKFVHPIGCRRQYRFLGKTFQAGGHSPARRRSIARNLVLLARRYGAHWPSFALLCAARLVYEALGILMAESDKLPKLTALAAGMASGLAAWQTSPPGDAISAARR